MKWYYNIQTDSSAVIDHMSDIEYDILLLK